MRFTPSSFDGDAPFGESYGIHVYWYVQEDGDGFITGSEGDFDYVVVVLDRRLGETTGWMGARGYDDDWDDLDAWSHMGYPGDLNSGQRPSWQGGFRIDGTDAAAQSIPHQADVFPGSRADPSSASGTATSDHVPSPCSHGRPRRTTGRAGAWTCATSSRSPAPSSPDAVRRPRTVEQRPLRSAHVADRRNRRSRGAPSGARPSPPNGLCVARHVGPAGRPRRPIASYVRSW